MRRIIIRATVFLLLGALVNIAVAWGIAAFTPQAWMYQGLGPAANWSDDDIAYYCSRWDGIGITLVRVEHVRVPLYIRLAGYRMDLVPGWGGILDKARESEFDRELREVIGAGWPFRALWSDHQHAETVNSATTGLPCRGGAIWIWAIRDSETRRLLPSLPIWPGFAINTLFYAAILWLLFAAPLALRRRVRIKHGVCPACAYPIGDSPVCTECGKPIPSPLRGRAREGVGRTTFNDAPP